jgi:hypothetical protein
MSTLGMSTAAMSTLATRTQLLQAWAAYLQRAAQQGALTRQPLSLQIEGIVGLRAGALEIYAGVEAPKLLSTLARHDSALLRQFVPWQFVGEPAVYMAGRYVRVEAGWPAELAETMIPLATINHRPPDNGRWIAGKNETGATVVAGLNDKTPHYLVAGQTGSGKSVALRSAVLQLSRDPGNRIVLVDGKLGEGLGELQHLPHVVGPVAVDGPQARAALAWSCEQMAERYRRPGRQSGRLVVVVDEFQEWAGDELFVDLLRRLAAQGRAAGVHLLAATQHPAVDAFGDTTTRRNLAGKLALRVDDPDASRVAVGGSSPRADYLLGAGDAYVIGPAAVHRIQAAYVGSRDLEAVSSNGWTWQLDEWPDLDAEALGQAAVNWSYNGAELAHSLVSAERGEGRPALVDRLESAGLPRPGAERAIRLLNLGRECHQALAGLGYGLCLDVA